MSEPDDGPHGLIAQQHDLIGRMQVENMMLRLQIGMMRRTGDALAEYLRYQVDYAKACNWTYERNQRLLDEWEKERGESEVPSERWGYTDG